MKELYKHKDSDYLLSYTKISGKEVKDIVGYVSNEFGDPTFKICNIVFKDDSEQGVEGEHDFPYIVDDDDKTKEVMEKIEEEQQEE